MTCGACSKILGKKGYKLRCSECEEWFHKGCVAIGKEDFELVSAGKTTWTCTACSLDDEEESSDEETGDESEEGLGVRREVRKSVARKSPKNKKSGKITREHLLERINVVINQNERLLKRISSIEKENRDLKGEIDTLKEEQKRMKKDLELIKDEKNTKKQELLNNSIIVSGLPTKQKQIEELKEIIVDIGKEINVKIGKEDFDCIKVGKEEGERLKVVFKSNGVKEDIMKAKKGKTLSTKNFGFTKDTIVYINHDLTAENQQLYKKTRDAKKQLGYKYAWVNSEGKIFLRKTDNSKIIRITSENYLSDLMLKKN